MHTTMKYDLINQKFGLLTALYPVRKAGRAMWHCRCDCGQEYDATSYNLRKGITWHCGWEIKGIDHDEQIYAGLNNALQKRS